MFNGQRTEVIFIPLMLNAIKFLLAVNDLHLIQLMFTPLNFNIKMSSYGYVAVKTATW